MRTELTSVPYFVSSFSKDPIAGPQKCILQQKNSAGLDKEMT